MTGKNISVYGIFANDGDLEYAVAKLKLAGFRNTDISYLAPRGDSNRDFVPTKSTKAPEGATAGVTTGAVLGGTLGWLAGIGALAIPGFGPLIAAGPIMAALAGASAGGALGGLTGGLIGLGIPEYEAKRFEGMIKAGKTLVSIHCDDADWEDKARHIMESCGAQDVAASGEARAVLTGASSERPLPRQGPFGRSMDLHP